MYGFIHPPKSGGSKFKHMFKDEPQVCYPLRAYSHATLDTWTQAFTAKVVDKFPCDKIITILSLQKRPSK